MSFKPRYEGELPKNPAHAILAMVARDTQMDLDSVKEVQRQRAQP